MISDTIKAFIENSFTDGEKKKAFERAESLISRGLCDENIIIGILAKNPNVPRRLRAEMYDKVNYLCRRYMDRIARFELDYDFIPDIDALKNVIICFLEAAPVFHSRFVDNHIAPYWKVSDYHIDDAFLLREVEDLQAAADEFLLQDIDISSNVQIKFALLTRSGKSKLCLCWNHMCMDGGDLKHSLSDIIKNYNEYTQNGALPLNFRSGTRAYECVYDDFDKDDIKKAKKLFANVSSHDKHALPLSQPKDGDKKMIIRKRVDKDIFEPARKKAKACGATVNDVISAAYIRAFYKLSECNPNERVGISCAVDLRRYIKNIENTGYTNHTTFMPCVVESMGQTMLDTLKSAAASNANTKADKFMGLHGLPLLNIGYSTMVYAQAELIVGAFYNNANLAVSNVGKIEPEWFALNGNTPTGIAVAGAAKKKPCTMMTALSYNGDLSISICTIGNENDKKLLLKFFDEIEKNLKELSA